MGWGQFNGLQEPQRPCKPQTQECQRFVMMVGVVRMVGEVASVGPVAVVASVACVASVAVVASVLRDARGSRSAWDAWGSRKAYGFIRFVFEGCISAPPSMY